MSALTTRSSCVAIVRSLLYVPLTQAWPQPAGTLFVAFQAVPVWLYGFSGW